MNIHEYQAKDILRAHGIPVPPGEVATTADEAVRIAESYGGMVVVKAQVHSGGRGKAGGVKLAKTSEEVREHAENILGMTISGLTVEKVLITPAEDIDTEAYVGVLVDRASQAATFMVSSEGGIDIEEVAHTNPDAIRKLTVDPRYGLMGPPGLLAGERALRRSGVDQASVQDHTAALRGVHCEWRLNGGDQSVDHHYRRGSEGHRCQDEHRRQ